MIEFDHIAIMVNNLEQSIEFYEKIGYILQNQFNDEEYRWATLILGTTRLEIFEYLTEEISKIDHIAYNFSEDKEMFEILEKTGYKPELLDIFYGDLNRKSFFIEDNNGISLQFIKNNNNL